MADPMTGIPPEAMKEACLAHAAFWQTSLDDEIRQATEAVLAAAAPHLTEASFYMAGVKAERERIYALLGNDHFVIFAEDGWTVEHSVDCRLAGDMTAGCAWWTALKRAAVTTEPDPEMLGRWRIDGIDSEGLPSLVRAEREEA